MHSEEIHGAFISPYIVSVIRTMRMKSKGSVVCTGWKIKFLTEIWSENLLKDMLEDLGVDGRRLITWILRSYGGVAWPGFVWLKMGTSGGLLYTW